MKRRILETCNAKKRRNGAGKGSHICNNYSGPSFSDLPCNVLVNVLLKLSIKRILVCKCVCKTWHDLISDPEFARFHFDQAQVYPLIQTSGFTFLSRMIYLVQPEHDDFEDNLDMSYYKSPIKFKLDSKMKLPLRNLQMLDPDSVVDSRNNCMKLNMKNHKYRIVNSCNGLLCLSNPSDNDPVIVFNPVTGEFVNLPELRTFKEARTFEVPGMSDIACGLGFSPGTNQYKVIRMFTRWIGNNNVMVAEVHVLGTDSWKDLKFFPKSMYKLFSTYLNGYLYWCSPLERCIISFDIEKECFESIPSPSFEEFNLVGERSMGVIGGELFVSEFYFGTVRFFAMKDHGAEKVWSEIFSFHVNDVERWPYGSCQPIKYMTNGALMMFHAHKRAFICKHPKKNGFKYLKVRGMESKVEAIAHIPSLVSLKHALSGQNAKVFNIKSRCAELKLHKETKGISIVEVDRNMEIDTEDGYTETDSE